MVYGNRNVKYTANMMNFGNFLHQFDPDTRKSIRLIESTDRKTINAELSLLFNETCLNEKILPRYTNIYIYIYKYIVN